MNHSYEIMLSLGVLIPLISFAILVFLGPTLGKPKASFVALAAIAVSCILASTVLFGWTHLDSSAREELTQNAFRYHWADFGKVPITVGVKLDSLTIIMYFMVTFIAFWIHFFSIGYMEGHSDEVDGTSKYHRFFAYLSLFCFSMLGLLISSSLLFLFIFWELVGLCSYLLIGFYFDKKYASNAAMKAFITNRVGDFGFIIGLAIVVMTLGTFDLDEAAKRFADQYFNDTGIFAMSINLFGWHVSGAGLATLMGIGLFCGAMGKSAQFPLHVWLPDAMAGPTPVSALIHAATMVAAGVYLVARVFRLLTPDAQMFIATIGCITLTITALIAMVQTDIKKVLAYSTLSQLGYMIFGMGMGAWVAALFHLMTHAFFKAMLFLGSGQVIEGCHHEQDIRKMGGLRTKMPVTCWTFFIGVLAIAGFGIPGTHFGLGGFFSKDEILAVAYERIFNLRRDTEHHAAKDINSDIRTAKSENAGVIRLVSDRHEASSSTAGRQSLLAFAQHDANHNEEVHISGDMHEGEHAHGTPDKLAIADDLPHLTPWLFWFPIIIAYVTPFYMMRVWWLTFCGKPRDHHVHDHAHENWKMYFPLIVLAFGTVISSYTLFRPMIADAAVIATDCRTVVAIDGEAHNVAEAGRGAMLPITHEPGKNPHDWLKYGVGFAWIIGMGLAWLIYRNGLGLATRFKNSPLIAPVHKALEEKLGFDHFYDYLFVKGTRAVGIIAYGFDKLIVDGLVNLTAILTRGFGMFAGRQLDMPVKKNDIGAVDALANGLAGLIYDIGTQLRRPQTGRIRNYVIFAAGAAALVLLAVLFSDQIAAGWNWLCSGRMFLAEK